MTHIHKPYDSGGRHIHRIVVHSSATTADMDIGVKEIDTWHKMKGWAGCGYHYVVRRSGVVEWGRDLQDKGAHARGYNQTSIGLCLIGGAALWTNPKTNRQALIARANFTVIQMEILASLLKLLHEYYPQANIYGHRDLPGAKTECPSFDVAEFCEEINLESTPNR